MSQTQKMYNYNTSKQAVFVSRLPGGNFGRCLEMFSCKALFSCAENSSFHGLIPDIF